MKKIKSINIVHSSTRNYEGALSKALEICEINNVAINLNFRILDKNKTICNRFIKSSIYNHS